jgi:16S rRNA (cytosine967-C5)-methyltransferase
MQAMKPAGRRAVQTRGTQGRPPERRSDRTRSKPGRPPESPVLGALNSVLRLFGPADLALRHFLRAHPELGRRDRGEIAETVFDVLRNRRRYAHLAQGGEGSIERRLALLSLALRDAWPGAGSRSSLPVPSEAERAWLEHCASVDATGRQRPLSRTTDPVAAIALWTSLPDWIAERWCARFGLESARALAESMLRPARLHLRMNLLKASDPAEVVASLRADEISAHPFPGVPLALEVDGRPALEQSSCFTGGGVEVQDVGSQLLAMLVGARRGQTVIDLCAGAGGKTLALAAAMRSLGQIFACDVSAERLRRMRPRLSRSGATNVQPFAIDSLTDPKLVRLAGRADAVLVDAPCTGSGTWRRNPDLKWRLGPRELERLIEEQRSLLLAATRLVRAGGVLVYGTCSLLAEENEDQVRWFEGMFPNFRREPAHEILSAQGVEQAERFCPEGLLSLRPDRDGTDGFFGVRWRAV